MPAKNGSSTHTEALLNVARQYRDAANVLFDSPQRSALPTYQLYAHLIELALKSFLRARLGEFPMIHDVATLLQLCTHHGLKSGPDLRNVTSLLQSENQHHGFRYFHFATTTVPEIGYVREEAVNLLERVTAEVTARSIASAPSSELVLTFTIGKPERLNRLS
jgi:hypothetical protein